MTCTPPKIFPPLLAPVKKNENLPLKGRVKSGNAGLYFFSKNNDAYKPFNHLLYIKLKFLNEHFVTRRKVNVTHYFMIVERDIKLQKGACCTIGGPIQCVVSCRDQCAHKHTNMSLY